MTSNSQSTLFYNAKPHIFEKAKCLRSNMTTAENILWESLRGKKILNLKFRAQHPIDIFIADFYCHPIKLVIEVDGSIHESEKQAIYDIGREEELNGLGINVIRFTNNKVLTDISGVVEEIKACCSKRLTTPNP